MTQNSIKTIKLKLKINSTDKLLNNKNRPSIITAQISILNQIENSCNPLKPTIFSVGKISQT